MIATIRSVVFAVFVSTVGLTAQPQSILGDWKAVLKAGPDEIHLTMHIAAGPKDTLTATMDSAEQGVKGVRVTSISLNQSNLTMVIESIHGTYQGTVNAAAGVIEGTWSQGQPTPLTFTRPPKSTGTAEPSELEGVWRGTLQIGGRPLPLIFHITTNAQGLAATMDSPDQGVSAVPVISARRDDDTLVLQLPNIGAKYQGVIAKDLSAIQGSFTQGGASLPLTLKRGPASK
jgi:serine-type D-Ala-D-Ala carboxypeptidase/endopeptidase